MIAPPDSTNRRRARRVSSSHVKDDRPWIHRNITSRSASSSNRTDASVAASGTGSTPAISVAACRTARSAPPPPASTPARAIQTLCRSTGGGWRPSSDAGASNLSRNFRPVAYANRLPPNASEASMRSTVARGSVAARREVVTLPSDHTHESPRGNRNTLVRQLVCTPSTHTSSGNASMSTARSIDHTGCVGGNGRSGTSGNASAHQSRTDASNASAEPQPSPVRASNTTVPPPSTYSRSAVADSGAISSTP